jgi:hypothetical protein
MLRCTTVGKERKGEWQSGDGDAEMCERMCSSTSAGALPMRRCGLDRA